MDLSGRHGVFALAVGTSEATTGGGGLVVGRPRCAYAAADAVARARLSSPMEQGTERRDTLDQSSWKNLLPEKQPCAKKREVDPAHNPALTSPDPLAASTASPTAGLAAPPTTIDLLNPSGPPVRRNGKSFLSLVRHRPRQALGQPLLPHLLLDRQHHQMPMIR